MTSQEILSIVRDVLGRSASRKDARLVLELKAISVIETSDTILFGQLCEISERTGDERILIGPSCSGGAGVELYIDRNPISI